MLISSFFNLATDINLCMITSTNDGVSCVLGCDAVKPSRSPTFQRYTRHQGRKLIEESTYKQQEEKFFNSEDRGKMLIRNVVNFYRTTRCRVLVIVNVIYVRISDTKTGFFGHVERIRSVTYFTSRFPVTASNRGYSSASALT